MNIYSFEFHLRLYCAHSAKASGNRPNGDFDGHQAHSRHEENQNSERAMRIFAPGVPYIGGVESRRGTAGAA
jgi:hypothetical protein